MKRAVLLVPALLALALVLSGCSVQALVPSTTLVGSTPTPRPTPLPTVPPVDQSSIDSFDNAAGNCVDAANQAINLITEAASGRFASSYFNTDMRLDLEPHGAESGCADAAHLTRYRHDEVYQASLSVWPLDTAWLNAGSVIRQQWLGDVLNALLKLYPHADVTVQVVYNGTACGSATIGAGKSGSPQIDPTCV